MDREPFNPLPYVLVGLIVNSALYLGAVFVAGLMLEKPLAWQGAIIAMGMTYVSYFVQIMPPGAPVSPALRAGQVLFVACSILAGIAAGIALL